VKSANPFEAIFREVGGGAEITGKASFNWVNDWKANRRRCRSDRRYE